MVEINNQRKAFLDMLAAGVGGTDNGRQKTRNHGYDVIVGGELFTDYSDHPRKLVTLGKTQINRRRTTSFFPVEWMLPQAAWPERLLSEKSGRCGIAVGAWRFTTMIDRGDIRQAIDRCSIIGSTAGRWLWSVRA